MAPTTLVSELHVHTVTVMDHSLDLRERRNMARNFPELDLLDLHKQGQDLYRQKKYEAALHCFDQVQPSNVVPAPCSRV